MDRQQIDAFDNAQLSNPDSPLVADGPAPFLMDAAAFSTQPSLYLRWVKPALDRILSLVALLVVSPLLVGISLAIIGFMGWPALIRQQRVGRCGKVFALYKFRTMTPDRRQMQMEYLGDDRRRVHKSPNDPRITPIGRFLRASHLDELPQFVNVLVGDISLVGPRPELVEIVAKYEAWQHRRHAVKPGITGIWQVSDRGDQLLFECTEYELQYLEKITLWADFKIMLQTIPAMARRSGI